jgi:hypothetical protein
MHELPKFARERLRVAASPGHPDADVLTAFAEQALASPERALVLEHLARCGECRDVVALALPPTDSVKELDRSSAKISAGSGNWWRWPVLRGAMVAAGIAAVASVGIYQYRHRSSAEVAQNTEGGKTQVARNEGADQQDAHKLAARTATTPQVEPRSETVAATPRQPAAVATKAPAGAPIFPQQTIPAGSAGGAVVGVFSNGPARGPKIATAQPPRGLPFASESGAQRGEALKQVPTSAPSRLDQPPAASQMVEVQSQAEALTVQSQPQDQVAPAQNLEAQNRESQNLESQNLDSQNLETQNQLQRPSPSENNDVVKAKPPVNMYSAASASPVPTADQPAQPVLARKRDVPAPRWTITSTGSLQRSFDGGKSWQDVYVSGEADATASSMQVEIVPKSQIDRNKDSAYQEKKRRVNPVSSPVFRAVAALGNEVWAGASGAMLYHSADAGSLWIRVLPSSAGAVLTGDCTRIELSDAQHIKVVTSTFETWITADAGQSWQKQ